MNQLLWLLWVCSSHTTTLIEHSDTKWMSLMIINDEKSILKCWQHLNYSTSCYLPEEMVEKSIEIGQKSNFESTAPLVRAAMWRHIEQYDKLIDSRWRHVLNRKIILDEKCIPTQPNLTKPKRWRARHIELWRADRCLERSVVVLVLKKLLMYFLYGHDVHFAYIQQCTPASNQALKFKIGKFYLIFRIVDENN